MSITYVIHDQTGEICEYLDLPVAYVHGGRSDAFPNLARTLNGKRVGFTTTISSSPEAACGAHDPCPISTESLKNVTPALRTVSPKRNAENESGKVQHSRVTRIQEGQLTVDANRRFAGKTLAYEVKIVIGREASAEEIASGEARPDLGALS